MYGLFCVLALFASVSPIVVKEDGQWASKRIPVIAGSRYRLTFRAKVEGEATVERNVQLEEALYDGARGSRGCRFPTWDLRFRDASGKVSRLPVANMLWKVVCSSEWQDIVDEFYAPEGVSDLEIVMMNASRRGQLLMTEPVLTPVTGKTVNINPDFSLGTRCAAGYGAGGGPIVVRMMPKRGGGNYLRVEDHAYLDPMPAKPNHRYRVFFRLWKDTPCGGRCNLAFQDGQGKSIPNHGSSFFVRKMVMSFDDTYRAPPDARRIFLTLGEADYESIEIFDLGE